MEDLDSDKNRLSLFLLLSPSPSSHPLLPLSSLPLCSGKREIQVGKGMNNYVWPILRCNIFCVCIWCLKSPSIRTSWQALCFQIQYKEWRLVTFSKTPLLHNTCCSHCCLKMNMCVCKFWGRQHSQAVPILLLKWFVLPLHWRELWLETLCLLHVTCLFHITQF